MSRAPDSPVSPAPVGGAPFSAFDELLDVARARIERQHPPTGYEVVLCDDGSAVLGVRPGHLNPATAQAWSAALRVEARRWYDRTPQGRAQRLSGAHTGAARLARRLAAARGLTVAHSAPSALTLTQED